MLSKIDTDHSTLPSLLFLLFLLLDLRHHFERIELFILSGLLLDGRQSVEVGWDLHLLLGSNLGLLYFFAFGNDCVLDLWLRFGVDFLLDLF